MSFTEMQSDFMNFLISLVENYGWYILLSVIIFIYVYQNILKSRVDEFIKYKDQQEYAAKYHKDPDLFVARQIAQQQAAMKLQEKYRRDAEEHQKKLEQKEAKKRDEIRAKLEAEDGGHRLGTGNDERSFKPGYNPLMGSGSGSSYRPPRRSACSRGGCG